MSDLTPPVPTRRRVTRVVAPARPVYDKAFREPILDSHIQLRGLSLVEGQAARVGLVTLGLLLVSLLFSNVWRSGELIAIGEDDRLAFVPTGLVPVTMVSLSIAWTLLVWGALRASVVIRLVVAVSFLLVSSFLATPGAFEVGDHRALRWGPHLIEVGYWLPVGALVASCLVVRLRRTTRWLLPVFRLAALVGVALVHLTHLWIEQAFVAEGFGGNVQILVDGAVQQVGGLMNPLIYVSAVLLIDFGLDVTEGVSVAARDASRRVALGLLVVLLAVKLYLEVAHRWDTWTTYVSDRPGAVVHTVAMTLVLAVTVRLVARFSMTSSFERSKETLLYASAVLLSVGIVSTVALAGLGGFTYNELDSRRAYDWLQGYPVDDVITWGNPAWAALALVAGLLLLRHAARGTHPLARELGSGMVVMGVWLVPEFVLDGWDLQPGLSFELIDVLVTVAVCVVLATRWRRTDTSDAITLGAITVFSWLVLSRGDWIAFLGDLAGLPGIFVVVFGIAFSLAGDSGFTRVSSKRLPQGSRVLMFVGYLILSVTILHWTETSHATDFSSVFGYGGFKYLGIPWAAWILGRRLIDLDDRIDAVEAEEDALEQMEVAAAAVEPHAG